MEFKWENALGMICCCYINRKKKKKKREENQDLDMNERERESTHNVQHARNKTKKNFLEHENEKTGREPKEKRKPKENDKKIRPILLFVFQ